MKLEYINNQESEQIDMRLEVKHQMLRRVEEQLRHLTSERAKLRQLIPQTTPATNTRLVSPHSAQVRV